MVVSRTRKAAVNLDDYLDEDEDVNTPVDDEEDEPVVVKRTRKVAPAPVDEDDEEDEPVVVKRTTRKVAPAPVADDEDEDVEAAFEDEDEDERPVRSSLVQSGWGAAKKAIANSSKAFTKDFIFTEDVQLVKFLVGDPIAVYEQHWINERTGRRSFTCLGGASCPLCKAGHSPDRKVAFTILNLSTDEPQVQLLPVGPRLAGQFEKFHTDPKIGPLDKPDRFWALSSSGKGNKKSYSIVPVKARDLADDYELAPAEVADWIAEAEPLDETAIKVDSVSFLRDIAKELSD